MAYLKIGCFDGKGWVPPSYLSAKSGDKLDTRRTQEVFRDDIIKISNKQQEAVMKRRFVTSATKLNHSILMQCSMTCLIKH